MYIYDWRSPIASVFYRFMLGSASYEAPVGTITDSVERKRQYDIKNSRLNYFLDTTRAINNELLKQLLSQNTTPKMKTIVETIQKEQDIVIRDLQSDLLMIQGVAGSGKTAIALHRAAYLLYQNTHSGLTAEQILILSPNPTFTQYIANVLPELGEENVISMVFEEMLPLIGQEKNIPSRSTFLKKILTDNSNAQLAKACINFKTSSTFKRILDYFITQIPVQEMNFQTFYFEEECIVTKENLQSWVLRHEEIPLAIRLEQLENHLMEMVAVRKGKRVVKQKKNLILSEIKEMTTLNLYALYQSLWQQEAYFFDVASNFFQELPEIRAYTLKNLAENQLILMMLSPCRICIHAFSATMITAIFVMYLLMKRRIIIRFSMKYCVCSFLMRNIPSWAISTKPLLNRRMLRFMNKCSRFWSKKSSLVTLDKSFRCTEEILQFALQFVKHKPAVQHFNRQGKAVTVLTFANCEDYLKQIIGEVKNCQEAGLSTICLLCKTQENCERLFAELQYRLTIRLFKDDKTETLSGNLLMLSYQAKGLEFDAVLICDAETRYYHTEDDGKILYVQCTRALHKLSLLAYGELTPFIDPRYCHKIKS